MKEMGKYRIRNCMEREALYRLREFFAEGREAVIQAEPDMIPEERRFLEDMARLALYPQLPILTFCPALPEKEKEEGEAAWYPDLMDASFFRLAKKLEKKKEVQRLMICGGVDDGKSTLMGRILYETMSEQQRAMVKQNPLYLRSDGSVDYAMLAGTSQEEAKQGITVRVSYSIFEGADSCFVMADVPGHEEYTRNMAYAARQADTAVIMVAAHKGIVPQTRRHTRICRFMGIRNIIFAVNKMDMVEYKQQVFTQISEEISRMMEEYPGCSIHMVPVAAKTGENVAQKAEVLHWYPGGTLLEVIQQTCAGTGQMSDVFCMPVQRICKSSQMKGAEIPKRVIQGEIISGSLHCGDELFIYPEGHRAVVEKIYLPETEAKTAQAGDPAGIVFDRELDVARGVLLTKEDFLVTADRLEADLLWASDKRLVQGHRYQVQIGTKTVPAVISKICYRVDVNTGEHRYAEHLVKNAMARCELSFLHPVSVIAADENRLLGTFQLLDRESDRIAGFGNIVRTVSEELWKENSREVTSKEREEVLGQRAGVILFSRGREEAAWKNVVERCLLRMGFHTVQLSDNSEEKTMACCLNKLLGAGLLVLLSVDEPERKRMKEFLLLEDPAGVFDVSQEIAAGEDEGISLKRIRKWASERIR